MLPINGTSENRIINADALQALRELPDGVIDTCVTSPPYYGLRDYGINGQIGLEETPDKYIERLVEVFREVKRVLRDDGTLWVNIGDSYAGSGHGYLSEIRGKQATNKGTLFMANRPPAAVPVGLKQKDLIGIPWMLAFALRADGWYLRQDIIWQKPNPMPESVVDRCTKSHEYIFIMSKSKNYYFNQIKESCSQSNVDDFLRRKRRKMTAQKCNSNGFYKETRPDLCRSRDNYMPNNFMRNKRSVWTVYPQPFKGAHFATFPPELIRPCILAGSRPGGIVLDPFFGSGTTGLVATEHGRGFIGVEINPEYVKIAQKRLSDVQQRIL